MSEQPSDEVLRLLCRSGPEAGACLTRSGRSSRYDALPSGVDVLILDGLAANAFRAVPRATLDADLLIVADMRTAPAMERRLVAGGFERPPGRRMYRAGRFQWRRLLWPSPDPDDPTMVDLFFAGADPQNGAFIHSVAARAITTKVAGRKVKSATPEDVVVFKALAIASGTRGPKAVTDEDDVRSIVGNPALELDEEYLRSMASRVGVLRVVARFLRGHRA